MSQQDHAHTLDAVAILFATTASATKAYPTTDGSQPHKSYNDNQEFKVPPEAETKQPTMNQSVCSAKDNTKQARTHNRFVNRSSRTLSKLKKFIKLCVRGVLRNPAQTNIRPACCVVSSDTGPHQAKAAAAAATTTTTTTTGECSRRRRTATTDEIDETGPNDRDTDGGYAWIILMVMFVINASTFGTARAYGLIFEKLAREDEQSRAMAALPFTMMGAIENMGGPLAGYLLARTGSWRLTVFVGSSLIALSHLLAYFFESPTGRILTLGLMCGLGLSSVTTSSFAINNAYFVRYRSRAFGLGLTGAAVGALYISPLCQLVLDSYDTNVCYLLLGFILLPNVPLSLLLRPKLNNLEQQQEQQQQQQQQHRRHRHLHRQQPKRQQQQQQLQTGSNVAVCNEGDSQTVITISGKIADLDKHGTATLWRGIKDVISEPLFHLIWPTQLLFCWLNFVFGMIIVDLGEDRGLTTAKVAQLIPTWALGQLVGRTLLGSLVDLKLFSYKIFTVITFTFISLATWTLNNVRIYEDILIPALVFILSMFIANLYILFNGLIANYMNKQSPALSVGISSFTGSFFLLPRAAVIGHYRDTTGNYDSMLDMFVYVSIVAALLWLVMPDLLACMRTRWRKLRDRSDSRLRLTLPANTSSRPCLDCQITAHKQVPTRPDVYERW